MNSADAATRAEVAAKLRAAKRAHDATGGRKLLRWDAARWQQFERTPPYTSRLKSAPILPMRAPLSSMYVALSLSFFCSSGANWTVLTLLCVVSCACVATRSTFRLARVTRRLSSWSN